MTKPPLFVRRIAEREASWFFRELGGKVPDGGDPVVLGAAARIDGWLHEILAFHRGVLQLRFARRPWPKSVDEEFDPMTSIVVRLECALHPAVGSTEALEAASVARLEAAIERCARVRARREPHGRDRPLTREGRELGRLERRAHRHVALAVRALVRVRGWGPCILPAAGAR